MGHFLSMCMYVQYICYVLCVCMYVCMYVCVCILIKYCFVVHQMEDWQKYTLEQIFKEKRGAKKTLPVLNMQVRVSPLLSLATNLNEIHFFSCRFILCMYVCM